MSAINLVEKIKVETEDEKVIDRVFSALEKEYEKKDKNQEFFNLIIRERNKLISLLRDYPNHIIPKKSVSLIVEKIRSRASDEQYLLKVSEIVEEEIAETEKPLEPQKEVEPEIPKDLNLSENLEDIKEKITDFKDEIGDVKTLVMLLLKACDINTGKLVSIKNKESKKEDESSKSESITNELETQSNIQDNEETDKYNDSAKPENLENKEVEKNKEQESSSGEIPQKGEELTGKDGETAKESVSNPISTEPPSPKDKNNSLEEKNRKKLEEMRKARQAAFENRHPNDLNYSRHEIEEAKADDTAMQLLREEAKKQAEEEKNK